MEKLNPRCPNCKKHFKYDLSKVKSDDIIICPHCKTKIKVNGNLKELSDVDKLRKSISKTIKKNF